MYLSVFSDVIKGATPQEVARKTREYGFRSVQWLPDEVRRGWGWDGRGASGSFEEWAAAFEREGIEICGVGGYLNIMARDPELRRHNIDLFASFLRRMPAIGVRYISTETGSLAASGDWDDDPANATPEAWEQLRAVTDELLEVAAQHDVVILYEPYVANVLASPELAARLVRECGSAHLGLIMDPTNWFDAEHTHPDKVGEVLERGFAAVSGMFHLAHAKDVVPPPPGRTNPDLPRAGTGILDYTHYLALLGDDGYDGPLVVEHLEENQVPATMTYVQGFIDAHDQRSYR
jgi:sugar phosphate isomerase/epimerase